MGKVRKYTPFHGSPESETANQIHAIANQSGSKVEILISFVAIAVREFPDISLTDYLVNECSVSVSRVKECAEVVIRDSDNEDDIADANTVLQALRAEIPPAAKHGTNQHGESGVRNTKSSDTAERVISRLKRDQPELAKQVEDGELSPHRAAIQAGIRKPMMQVRKDDPVKAVQALLRCYSKQELIDALGDL